MNKLTNPKYLKRINEWTERDLERLQNNKLMIENGEDYLKDLIFSSIQWPIKFDFPIFEVKVAYATPTRFYQDLFINNERIAGPWAHDTTRAIGFKDDYLILISKRLTSELGKEYYSHYSLLHFNKSELIINKDNEFNNITIGYKGTKQVTDLVTGINKEINVSFNFIHKNPEKAIVSKNKANSMSKIKALRNRGLEMSGSKFQDYVITVPHFVPHPYLLDEFADFGFINKKMFKVKVFDYLNEML